MVEAVRHVKLFRNGRNQALRIPVDFELPGTEAVLHRDGNRLIIEPMAGGELASLLDSWGAAGDTLPDIDDPALPPKDIF